MQDDPRKKATPPAKPKDASFKKTSRNEFNKDGGKTGRKNALFQNNECDLNPEQAAIKAESKPRKAKREPRLDPFMVRQAKLKAKQAQ